MTNGVDVPGPLVAAVTARVGTGIRWRCRSWPRATSRVWEVQGDSEERVFAKVHPTPRFHGREVAAYTTWVRRLGDAAPVLLDTVPEVLGIIVSAVPGRPVRGQRLTPVLEREVHRRAGGLLRRVHDAGTTTEPAPAVPGQTVRKVLGRADAGSAEVGRARKLLEAAAALVLPQVPGHGDFQPRNWLLDRDGAVRVIDFERAEPGPVVRDLRMLPNGAWAGRPDLREAFFAGYGRTLTGDEKAALAAWTALDALDSARWGRKHGDAEVEARGQLGLARLRDGP